MPGVKWVKLDVLESEYSRNLLIKSVPRVSVRTADLICDLCGHLPLAVRAASGMLEVSANLAAEAYAEMLRDERRRLERIGSEGVEHGVKACLNLSYQLLDAGAARVLRCLTVFPASFDAEAEKVICDDSNHAALNDLVRRNLVLYDDAARRFRLHDLVRLFGADLAREASDDLDSLAVSHGRYYIWVLEEANKGYEKGETAARAGLATFDKEWSNIEAGYKWGVTHAARHEQAAIICSQFPNAGADLLHLRLRPREHVAWQQSALECSRRLAKSDLSYRESVLKNLLHLGHGYESLGDVEQAIAYHEEALQIACETKDLKGEASVLATLGDEYACVNKVAAAKKCLERALVIAQKLGDEILHAKVLTNIGNLLLDHEMNEPAALEMFETALPVARGTGTQFEANLLCSIANIQVKRGETTHAHELYERGRSIFQTIGDHRSESNVLGCLGVIAETQGDATRALECYEQQFIIARDFDDRRGQGLALYNSSLLLHKVGDRSGAIERAEQALSLFESLKDLRAATVRKHLRSLNAIGS